MVDAFNWLEVSLYSIEIARHWNAIGSNGNDGDQRELITNKGDNKWKKQNLWGISQLCTKQVGTGKMIKWTKRAWKEGNKGKKLE